MFIPLSFLLLLSVLSFTLASPAPTIVSSSTHTSSKGSSRSVSTKKSSISTSSKAHSTFIASKSSEYISSKKLSPTVSSKRSFSIVSLKSSPAIVSLKKSLATVSSKQSSVTASSQKPSTASPKTTSRSVSLKTSTSASSVQLSIPVPSETTASNKAGPDATSSSQIQAFEVTYTGYHDPGQDHTLYPEYFFTTVSNPVTNTTTGCLFYRVYSPRVRYPSVWTYCEDPTFAIKMDYYSYNGPSWGLEFRHQYQEDGQKCDDEFSDDCTTVHAFVSIDSNTPGFTSNARGFSETDYYKGPAYADVTFRCTGDCGVVSTEKIEPYHVNG